MANPPCPNPEIYDAGNCCGGACFEQETPEIIAAANAGTLYPPAPQAAPEAGKAVDVTKAEIMAEKIAEHLEIDWDGDEPFVRSDSIEAGVCAALASVATSGAEPVAWTGSGSIAAMKAGLEGCIWPERASAHPIPLYAAPHEVEHPNE